MRPPSEYKKKDKKTAVWQLLKRLYGLKDAPRGWYLRVAKELMDLGCERIILDQAVFVYRKTDNSLGGILGVHVDDFLFCGDDEFKSKVVHKFKERITVGDMQLRGFSFVGWEVHQKENGDITISQENYVKQIREVKVTDLRGVEKTKILGSDKQTVFRSGVGSLNWLANNTRPDLAFEVMELSTRFGKATVDDLRRVARCIKKSKELDVKVKFSKLGDLEKAVILVYGDGAHGNLWDGVSSTEGKLVLAVGEKGKCCPLTWASNKIDRVVRSPLAAETVAFTDAVDEGGFCRALMEEVLGLQKGDMDLVVVTDSNSLHEALGTTGNIKDRRSRIDIVALRQCSEKGEFTLAWQPRTEMLADPLTKRGANPHGLRMIFEEGEGDIVFRKLYSKIKYFTK